MQSDSFLPEPIASELSEDTSLPRSHERYPGENQFERILWSSRYCVLIAVIFSIIGAIVLFIAGTLILIETILTSMLFEEVFISVNREIVLIGIIESTDFYLIAVALMIFSFGLYELFIANINIARQSDPPLPILRNESLGRLKSNIINVIIMVLIVTFFQRVLSVQFDSIFELFLLALSIFVISIGVFYVHKDE